MDPLTILFYITGHGLGHASRVCEVINTVAKKNPDFRIIIRTQAPRWFFDFTMEKPFYHFPCELDFGVIQKDYFEVNILSTLRAYQQLIGNRASIISSELDFITREKVSIVFADIPPLAFDIAMDAGIPAIAHSNFSWDWIYTPYVMKYSGYAYLVDDIRASYKKSTILLKLPLHGDMSVFPHIEEIPFVARCSKKAVHEIRKELGLPSDVPVVFISFGGIQVSLQDIRLLSELHDYYFISTPPTHLETAKVRIISNEELKSKNIKFEDLVHVSDVVMSKPSYGIISECIANKTRFIYCNRGDFVESEPLIAGIKHYLPNAEITRDDLFAGYWKPYLQAVMEQEFRSDLPPVNGADVAADILKKYLI